MRDFKKDFRQEREEEIWSEYFRIKNRLMDYDENLRDAITNARLRIKLVPGSSNRDNFAKAQKHIGMILDLGTACGAIPPDADKKDVEFIEGISIGKWRGIEDFEKAQKMFRKWYVDTKFYNITRATIHMLAPHEL